MGREGELMHVHGSSGIQGGWLEGVAGPRHQAAGGYHERLLQDV